MKAGNLLKHLRLIPAVILVGGGLLVLKGTGLVMDARAQSAITGQVAAAEPKPTTDVAVASESIADESETTSAAEVDVLTSLSKRRSELDARDQDLAMRANLIAAAEKRVDDKIAGLKTLQTQINQLLVQRDAAEQKQLDALVKSYSSMKPKDAARIFNNLDDTVLLNVSAAMKPDVLGAILAMMQADNAQKLTLRLANRLKAPDPVPPPVAVTQAPAQPQLASTDPTQLATSQTSPINNPPATPPSAAAPVPQPPTPATTPPTAKQQASSGNAPIVQSPAVAKPAAIPPATKVPVSSAIAPVPQTSAAAKPKAPPQATKQQASTAIAPAQQASTDSKPAAMSATPSAPNAQTPAPKAQPLAAKPKSG